jgi:hypothetical protein
LQYRFKIDEIRALAKRPPPIRRYGQSHPLEARFPDPPVLTISAAGLHMPSTTSGFF